MTVGDSFHKETFARIPKAKRDLVYTVAIKEFAEQGYAACSINDIAKKCGISIGSLYSYFDSKEDLFLAVAAKGRTILARVLADLDCQGRGFFACLEQLFLLAIDYAERHPDLCRIYLDLSTEQLAAMSGRLNQQLESDFLAFYQEWIGAAKRKGEVRAEQDENLLALLLDNIVIMLQFSYASSYYKERLRRYLGADLPQDAQALARLLTEFVQRAIAP